MPEEKTEEKAEDEWETDPDFVNDVSEEEQRWGSKTIEGSGRTAGAIEYGNKPTIQANLSNTRIPCCNRFPFYCSSMQKLVEDISRTTSTELKRKRYEDEINPATEKLQNPTITVSDDDAGRETEHGVVQASTK